MEDTSLGAFHSKFCIAWDVGCHKHRTHYTMEPEGGKEVGEETPENFVRRRIIKIEHPIGKIIGKPKDYSREN